MTAAERAPDPDGRMPRAFLCWAVASSTSALGTSVMAFGIAWSATGIDARLAGVVLTLVVAPRVLLLMIGGAVADRIGARRMMIAGDAVMCAVAFLLALVTATLGMVVWCLLLVSLIGGVVDAFYLPASGALPRLFLPEDRVAQGMALTSGLRQAALLGGPPLGALIVMAAGLAASAGTNALTFAVILVVLVAARPPREGIAREASRDRRGEDAVSLVREILGSLSKIRKDPLIRGLLGPVGLLACAVLPLIGLGTALLARDRGWGAGDAGMIESAWFVGTLAITLVIARVGTGGRAGLIAGIMPVCGGCAVVLMAVGPEPVYAVVGAALLGGCVSLCTTHVGPMFLMATPEDQVSRFQAVFVLVQSAPLLVTNNLFAAVAAAWGASAAFAAAALLTGVSGIWLLLVPSVRHAHSPTREWSLPAGESSGQDDARTPSDHSAIRQDAT